MQMTAGAHLFLFFHWVGSWNVTVLFVHVEDKVSNAHVI
jgi:hypothetical protein